MKERSRTSVNLHTSLWRKKELSSHSRCNSMRISSVRADNRLNIDDVSARKLRSPLPPLLSLARTRFKKMQQQLASNLPAYMTARLVSWMHWSGVGLGLGLGLGGPEFKLTPGQFLIAWLFIGLIYLFISHPSRRSSHPFFRQLAIQQNAAKKKKTGVEKVLKPFWKCGGET